MEKFRNRFIAFFVAIAIVFSLLGIQLNTLTAAGDDAEIQTSMTRTVTLTGQRGNIYDSQGQLLAYDQKSFNVEFKRDYSKATSKDRSNYTQIIRETIAIVEKNGGETIDSFNIKRDENLEFYFDFGVTREDLVETRKNNWIANMYIDEDLYTTPEEIYLYLRNLYQIPADVDYEEAAKILSIWQEVQLNSYNASVPIVIAENVDENTVAEIEQRSMELEGMSISESTVRVYPKDSLAAHSIGYLGKIQDSSWDTLKEQGYSSNDLMGLAGVESTMESVLTPNTSERRGKVVNEVDTKGTIIRELEREEPTDGNNISLTIDSDLQRLTEQALEENIKQIRAEQEQTLQENPEEYLEITGGDLSKIRLASYGAAVVMDVKTGDVLALANYPSYDLNLFTGGISDEDYAALLEDEGLPLFNKAIASKNMPGSIFKLLTGLAGLAEGAVTVNETIKDEGLFDKYTREGYTGAPACWKWNDSRTTHGDENIVAAIKDSCNYYFFTVADRIGIDKLAEWGEKVGLSQKTGIQLPGEVEGQIGGQDVLYDNTKSLNDQKTSLPILVYRSLVELLREFCEDRQMEVTDEQLGTAAERLIELVGTGDELGDQIRVIMREELGIPETVSYTRRWHNRVSTLLSEITWNANQTIRTGIGQSVVSITPIAAARYIAALVNGGKVYQANIIKNITDPEGNIIEESEPVLVNDLGVDQAYLDAIKEGMKSVVSAEEGGTAANAFAGFEYKDDIGGKTGSAQISTSSNNIDLENTSWFAGFAPFDDPEIAIVVYIPHGIAGSKSSYTAREIMQYYLDKKAEEEADTGQGDLTISGNNQLLTP